jgi:hypothetical protein
MQFKEINQYGVTTLFQSNLQYGVLMLMKTAIFPFQVVLFQPLEKLQNRQEVHHT